MDVKQNFLPSMVWREKNGYAVSPRETLRFVSHLNYFEQVCEQD